MVDCNKAGVNMTDKKEKLDKKELLKLLAEIENKEEQPISPALAEDKRKEEPKPVKVNLACVQTRADGFLGIDKVKTDATDIVHDLEEYPWPFENNSVDEIACSHYVEHTKDLIKFMDEICRILKSPYTNNKGEEIKSKATIIAPYYSSIRCWQDPTHIRAISEYSFLYFNKKWRTDNKLDHYGIQSDFDFTYGYQLDPVWANRSEDARVFAIKHYINVILDIHVVLTKR